MAKRVTSLDMQGLEILNVLAQLIAGNPSSPAEGQFWYDSTAKKFKYRTDSANIDPTARANHTGTQTASTISDFDTQVRTNRLDQMANPTASVSLNAQKITNIADGSAVTDAASWGQVQALSAGRDWKESVRVATTAAGTLASSFENGDTVDGVALSTGDRILIKDQSTGSENGIYTVNASGAPTRATDADTSSDLNPGATVSVEEGTTNADTRWILATNAPITLGSTALTFTKDAGETTIGGAGLTKTGSTLDVGQGTGITVNANDVAIDSSVVVRKFAADCAAATSTTVPHNLGTRDVTVSVYRTTSPWDEVLADVEHTSTNTVIVRFAVAPSAGEYRIVVHG